LKNLIASPMDWKLWSLQKSVWVFHVNVGACNNCDIEIVNLLTPKFDVERFGIKLVGSPRHADALLVTGVAELKSNPNRPAVGTVVEGQIDRHRGPTATLLVQAGTLRVGDALLIGTISYYYMAQANRIWETVFLDQQDAGGIIVHAHPGDPSGTSLASITSDLHEQTRIIDKYMFVFFLQRACNL
jgi:hypothetical protein